MRVLMKRIGIPFYKLPGLAKRVKEKMSKGVPKADTFNGMDNLLKKLSTKYKLGILSSNSKENIKLFLKNNKVDKYFEFIYSDSSMFGKDVVIKKMFGELNISKEEFVYVGDEHRDVLACQKLGVFVIAVTWGYNSKKFLRKAKPDFIVDKPQEIEGIMKII